MSDKNFHLVITRPDGRVMTVGTWYANPRDPHTCSDVGSYLVDAVSNGYKVETKIGSILP